MKRNSQKLRGYTAIEVLLVASIVGLIPIGVYMEAYKKAEASSCMSNLRNVYIAVQMYEMDFERMPDIKFYPKSASEKGSITEMLTHYIDDENVYICPAMPDELKEKGLTYIWNDNYNGKMLYSINDKAAKWLMTEMTAVKPEIPAPHNGAYNVLFLDGHVENVKRAVHIHPSPAGLRKDGGYCMR